MLDILQIILSLIVLAAVIAVHIRLRTTVRRGTSRRRLRLGGRTRRGDDLRLTNL